MMSMSAALQFSQTFSGNSTTINSTIDTSAVISAIKTGITSQLTSDVKPVGTSSFYAVPDAITSNGKYF